MPRRYQWFPQFNWPVFGPLIVALALIVGVSGLLWSLSLTGRSDRTGVSSGGRVPGTGGGAELRAPDAVRSKLFSLSARVNGSPTIRRGPGTQYEAVSKASDGQEFHVIACSPGCEWLRLLSLADEGQWWLPAVFLSVGGKVEQLPVLSPAEPAGR